MCGVQCAHMQVSRVSRCELGVCIECASASVWLPGRTMLVLQALLLVCMLLQQVQTSHSVSVCMVHAQAVHLLPGGIRATSALTASLQLLAGSCRQC